MRQVLFSTILISFLVPSLSAQDQTFEFGGKETLTLAFGSCNRQNLPQPMWQPILAHQPDLFMFLGDNIYGDTDDMKVLEKKYDLQKNQVDYKKLRTTMPVIGLWDDHDYGKNDAGKEYPFKEESQQLFLDFFDVSKSDVRRERKGIYSSHDLKWKSHSIRVILLDARYHRDELERINRVYQVNENSSILGEEQWNWLDHQLSDEEVSLYIIASGIQFIPEDHDYEKWANFPSEVKRFKDVLASSKAKGIIILSGDRHISEFSKEKIDGLDYPLVEFTSSGLTHSSTNFSGEPNRKRILNVIKDKSFGLVKFYFQDNSVALEMRGTNNLTLQEYKQSYP